MKYPNSGACQAQDERIVKAFAVMFRRVDELCRRHLQSFDQEIVNEGKKLVRKKFRFFKFISPIF